MKMSEDEKIDYVALHVANMRYHFGGYIAESKQLRITYQQLKNLSFKNNCFGYIYV